MKRLRWVWPIVLLAGIVGTSWIAYRIRPGRALDVAVLDKTVPFRNYLEHRSLFWLLRHERVVKPDGTRYDTTADYVGAYPPERPGDPPARIRDLDVERAERADLVYLADTYGVYRDDLRSEESMTAALERSPKIYGGLELAEAQAAARSVERGKTLVAEFNTLGSPTGEAARTLLERTLGVRWTRWIGRYFAHLDDPSEVPEWLRKDYEREWQRPWLFRGPGYVLLQDDSHCEVLRVGEESERIGLTLDRAAPIDRLLSHAADRIPYPYWFDIVSTGPETQVLATFRWHLTPAGAKRLEARALPPAFAAVTRKVSPGPGVAYYFAGDFADNPMPDQAMPFGGYVTGMRWLHAAALAPSETAFYWRFYYPMVSALLRQTLLRNSGAGALPPTPTPTLRGVGGPASLRLGSFLPEVSGERP